MKKNLVETQNGTDGGQKNLRGLKKRILPAPRLKRKTARRDYRYALVANL
jgi:hypothetical protein